MYSLGLTNNIIWVTRERERESERYIYIYKLHKHTQLRRTLVDRSIHTLRYSAIVCVLLWLLSVQMFNILCWVCFPLLFSRLFNLRHFYDTIFISCCFLRIINVVVQLAIASNQPLNMSHLSLNTFRRLWCARRVWKFFSKFMFSSILTWIYVLAPGIRCASSPIFICAVCGCTKKTSSISTLPSSSCSTFLAPRKTIARLISTLKTKRNPSGMFMRKSNEKCLSNGEFFFLFLEANRLRTEANATQTHQTVVGVLWG